MGVGKKRTLHPIAMIISGDVGRRIFYDYSTVK